MEESWERRVPAMALSQVDIGELLQPAFPHADIETIELLGGGLVNSNYKLALVGRAEPVVLRVYTRDYDACATEANILKLVHATVPVPEVLYASPGHMDTEGDKPYLVLSWIDGIKPHHAMRAGTPADAEGIGHACGATLAAIARYTFPAAGFFGPDLNVAQPFSSLRTALGGHTEECLAEERVRARLGSELASKLDKLVAENGSLFDELEGETSLVHSDYKAVNLLVRHTASGWAMAGVLDWEFAHSGTPLLDLAILLRESARLPVEFERGVVRGFRDGGGRLPPNWKRICKLLDLVNLCDFLRTEDERDVMLRDVTALVRSTVEQWDSFTPDESI